MFFFTLVTTGRRPLFATATARHLLHDAIEKTRAERPWDMEAIVLLPDHLHMLWCLPEGDVDYSGRIAAMKKRFTRAYVLHGAPEVAVSSGQRRHRLRGVWQRRFWEHAIRDARDLKMHLDYIHLNPVKHGLVVRPVAWKWSSFRRFVENGEYERNWLGRVELP